MNKNIFQGIWEQLKGTLQRQWGILINDDLEVAKGNRKIHFGKIKEEYGHAQKNDKRQLKQWCTKRI